LGGLKNVTIGKELLQAARGARSWYFAHLAENKDAEEKVSEEETLENEKIQGYGSRSLSNFGWLAPESEIWVPVPQISIVEHVNYTNNTSFFPQYFGPNCSGAGAKHL